MALAVVLGVGMSVFLFMVLPTFLTGGLLHFFPGFPMWGRNLIEGVLKVLIFLLYLIFCSRQKDIYRVFQYHGAEHKTIFCYEAGLPLTVENVRIQPRPIPAAAPAFCSCDLRVHPGLQRGVRHLAHHQRVAADGGPHRAAALVVGITYEFNRWVGRNGRTAAWPNS